MTGASIPQLQVILFPLLGALPPLLMYPLFARVCRNEAAAIVGAFLFAIQSDVLFTTYRSTHEKFTWIMIGTVLLLFTLMTSTAHRPRTFASIFGTTAALYVAMFALFSLNVFFGNTFLLILLGALFFGLANKRNRDTNVLRRLAYTCTLGIVLFFSLIMYLYEPATNYLRGLASYTQIILTTLLSFESQSTPQYQYVVESWGSTYLWLALTTATWVILGLSGYTFLRRFVLERGRDTTTIGNMQYHLWFGSMLVLAIGILADRFGRYSSNLELRLVPVVIIFAAPIAGYELVRWAQRTNDRKRKTRMCVIVVLILALAPLSVMKATADPAVSSIRPYVTPGERASVQWALSVRFDGPLWTDPGQRILEEAYLLAPATQFQNVTAEFTGNNQSKYYITSPGLASLYPAQLASIVRPTDSVIYCNGDAVIGMHS